MSKYRQTMAEAYAQVQVQENDYLKSKLTDTQIANIKQLWMRKTARDVTPSVKDMIKKMDIPTQLAIKHANINQLSKLVETLDESFSDAQVAILKREYEPMRNKTISIANANKLGQLFTKFDKDKNALEKLYGGNIPFVSTMAMTRLMTKHGYKADQLNKLRKEERFPLDEERELEILDEATLESVEITEGKIDSKKFDSLKKGDSMTITYQSTMSGTKSQKFVVKSKSRSAKYNTDKVTMYPDGNPNMARFFLYKRASGDVSMATGDMAATIKSVNEETLVEFTTQQIKQAYGIANDKRYKGGNYSGAVSAIEKIAKGLSSHPDVQNVLKRTNENLDEGKMSQIDAMQKDGKSAAEIAKLMKLDVKTVKSILGEVNEEELHEFKKMTVTFKSMDDMSKASTDLAKHGFTINAKGMVMKVDGKGADLNKYATDLKNFYKADIRAESFSIDESADEDFYNPVYEACWVGYTQKGMKKKGDKMVPNCVPEETIKEEDDPNKLANELKQKENEIAALKQKAETEKAKNVQKSTEKMVNPETGEPLLQVGIAYKHLKAKMAKDAAAKDDAEEKEKQDKKKLVAKFKDRIRESLNLDESDASEKAKSLGLTYMKFGRYGKDGKVTHKSIGGNLTAVDKDEKPIKEPKSDKSKDEPKKDTPKDEPKAEPKPALDTFQAQKDLEDMVTDGMIDVEDDGQGGVNMTKEYEPSQDYEADRDVKAIKDYLKDKGIDEKDILVDVESEDEYIQINVEVRGKKMDEMAKDKAYAIGMATAKKKYNDEPPLDKKTIKKGHEIGDKLKNEDHPAKKIFEQIEGLKNKAEKSGMPYGILKKVYDRGMAAWRGGHRPGASQQQWAFARVNSFITKSSGTWGGADKDLAAKVKGK